MKLIVNEIFYSLQGEGARAGEASIFIRLTKCNLACAFCDTDFADGTEMTLDEILEHLSPYPSNWIIWTGGEPSLQLQNSHIAYFKKKGYKQAIETNGTRSLPKGLDYISCSPKQSFENVKDLISHVDEIRLAVKKGDIIPEIEILPKAKKYYLSPIFDAQNLNKDHMAFAVDFIKKHPQWTLSLQIHKLIEIE